MKSIAFIGTGVMGKSIVEHLMNATYDVTVYTRTKEKAQSLIDAGAKWAATPAEVAQDKDIIFTMVGYPQDVEEVVAGEQGVLQTAKAGAVLIDMTTSEPTLAQKIYEKAQQQGISALDAPVSGGDLGAKNGTLSIMVGGDEVTFTAVYDVLKVFGDNVIYQGQAGAGQHTKMCNQIAIASGMIGVSEAMAYGLAAGLTMDKVLQSITTGAAGSWGLTNLAPRMIKGDYEAGFYIKHIVKDMGIALRECAQMNITLPGLALANDMYTKLVAAGYGEEGTQALIRSYK